jgi:hypothetical protein
LDEIKREALRSAADEILTRSDMRQELHVVKEVLVREICYMKEQIMRELPYMKEQLLRELPVILQGRGQTACNGSRVASRQIPRKEGHVSINDARDNGKKADAITPYKTHDAVDPTTSATSAWMDVVESSPKENPRYQEAKTNVIKKLFAEIEAMHSSLKADFQKLRGEVRVMSTSSSMKPWSSPLDNFVQPPEMNISECVPGVVEEIREPTKGSAGNLHVVQFEEIDDKPKLTMNHRKTLEVLKAQNRSQRSEYIGDESLGGSRKTLNARELYQEAQQFENKKKGPGRTDGTATGGQMFNKSKQKNDLDKEDYTVTMYYHDDGLFQRIARSDAFSNITLFVICANAVYLGVDADWNDSETLYEADWGFIFLENTFAVYFLVEWIIRFGSFKNKRDCLKDFWFKFDSALVVLSVMETWLMPMLLSGVALPTAPLRLLRLLRLARMARIIRTFPELVTMIKGGFAAQRAVTASFAALIMVIYVFSIIMNMLLKESDHDLLSLRFQSIPHTMWTLLMDGTFMDNTGSLTRSIWDHYAGNGNIIIAVLALTVFMFFTILSALTVLNMLIGVQCEVVSAVAQQEKDESEVGLMKRTVLVMLKHLDMDGSGAIDKQEMQTLLHDPEALEILELLQIDVKNLLNFLAMLFTLYDDIAIADVMELMLQFRGDRTVTVKDLIDSQSYVLWLLNGSAEQRNAHVQRSLCKAIDPTRDSVQEECMALANDG